MGSHRWWLIAGVCCASLCGRAGALPVYDDKAAMYLGHVTVIGTADADPTYVRLFGEICDVAAAVYQQEIGLTPPANPRLYVSPCRHGHCSTVTDRRARIYVNYVKPAVNKQLICSDYQPNQAGPVHVLCRAVAELFNPHRIPGLEQLLASRYAVPAVLDQLGPKAWPRQYDIDGTDGEGSYRAHAGDGQVSHPRWSAALALGQAVDKLKPAVFARTVAAVKGEGRPALAMLRKLLVAQDASLEAAFAEWDRAVDLPADKDGSLLLSSFEDAAQMTVWPLLYGCQVGASSEWATDGRRCGVLTFAPIGWPQARVIDPDWRFGDWSSFGTFEFDARNPGERPLRLNVEIADDESDGHGCYRGSWSLAAGQERHCVVPLLDPAGQAPFQGIYYDGHVRSGEIAVLRFTLPDEGRTAPTVLWVDNVRLKP